MSIPSNFNPLGLNGSVNYPAGTMILYGNNRKHTECFNLNERANCQSLFRDCENISFPEGVNFAACTNGSYMFSNAKNIEFQNAEIFENITNASGMFSDSVSIKGISKISFKKPTDFSQSFARIQLAEDLLEATFENATGANQAFIAIQKIDDTMINLPKATFEKVTTKFSNIFVDFSKQKDKRVNLPQATFAAQTDMGGNIYSSGGVKFNIPNLTWESLTTTSNKNWYFIFPMLHLNLKSLTDGTGMFHGDGMDVDTLETIALGPVDIRDETTGIKRYTDGSVHTITLGIDASLQSEYENPDSEIGERIRAALSEINSRGWTVDLEWNVPTTWE